MDPPNFKSSSASLIAEQQLKAPRKQARCFDDCCGTPLFLADWPYQTLKATF
jgi:hypothetical protein